MLKNLYPTNRSMNSIHNLPTETHKKIWMYESLRLEIAEGLFHAIFTMFSRIIIQFKNYSKRKNIEHVQGQSKMDQIRFFLHGIMS